MTGVRGQGARADFFGDGVAVGESCLETVELGAHEGLRYGPERRFPRPFDARATEEAARLQEFSSLHL